MKRTFLINCSMRITFLSISLLLLTSFFTGCESIDNSSFADESNANLETKDSVYQKESLLSPITNPYKVSVRDVNNLLNTFRCNTTYKIEALSSNQDTLLYVVNHANGWVIVAGDKRVNPIVAKSGDGVTSLTMNNDNFKAWLDSYADELHAMHKNDSVYVESTRNVKLTENTYTKLWDKISPRIPKVQQTTRSNVEYKWVVVSYTYCDKETRNIEINHLLKTSWGQEAPWNTKLPRDAQNGKVCPTGCVAVSLAQIVYYMHNFLGKPNGLYHDINISTKEISGKTQNIGFSRSNFVSNSPRWDLMALNIDGTKYDKINYGYVGDLMLDIGNRLGIKYSGTGSGTNVRKGMLVDYGLTYNFSDYDDNKVISNLRSGLPVNVSATQKDKNGNKIGHSWVIDGLATITRHYMIEKHFEYSENWMKEAEYYNSFEDLRNKYHINSEYDYITVDGGSNTNEYLLMNWGWNGSCNNDYFSTYPSTEWNAGGYNFKYDKSICYDFK